jgi:hypothetical protein
MKKIVIAVALVLFLGLIVTIFNRNILARFIVIHGIKKTCGLGVHIGKLNIGLPNISISNLKIYNPPGFKDRVLADIPEVYVDFDLPAFFKKQVHLRKIKLEIKELNVILNEQGKLNVNSLALLMPKPGTGKPPEVKIDELALKINKVSYKGYFPVAGVKSREFDPNIDETLHNVTNPSKVAAEILQRILFRAGIGNFANFDVKGVAGKSVEEMGIAVEETLDKAKEGLKGIFPK